MTSTDAGCCRGAGLTISFGCAKRYGDVGVGVGVGVAEGELAVLTVFAWAPVDSGTAINASTVAAIVAVVRILTVDLT